MFTAPDLQAHAGPGAQARKHETLCCFRMPRALGGLHATSSFPTLNRIFDATVPLVPSGTVASNGSPTRRRARTARAQLPLGVRMMV